MTINLKDLTTADGQPIVVMLESEDLIVDLEKEFTNEEFLANLLSAIDMAPVDFGSGIIYALLNKKGEANLMNTRGFAEWQADPTWEWEDEEDDLDEEALMAMLMGMTGGQLNGGPELADARAYLKDPIASAIDDESAHAKMCETCLHPACPIRHANFDKVLFDSKVAARKAVTA